MVKHSVRSIAKSIVIMNTVNEWMIEKLLNE